MVTIGGNGLSPLWHVHSWRISKSGCPSSILRKKYNDANKTLGSTGAGLTAEDLKEDPQLKKLLDKILENFPWWEEVHGFWRTNPSYNTVFSTGDPGQDFAAEAQRYFTGEKSTTAATASLPLVGDGWVSVSASPSNEGPGARENEEFDLEDGDPHDDSIQASPAPDLCSNPPASVDDNIDPVLRSISSSVYNTMISCSTPTSLPASTDPLSNVSEPSSVPTLTSHARRAGAGNKGKMKAAPDVSPFNLGVPTRAPSSSGSSVAHKRPRDLNSEVSTKISETSDSLICQIQNSADAKNETKRMRYEAQIVGKELRSPDKNAQHEHDLKLKMVEKEHELSIETEKTKQASERTKQLELELQIEQVRIARLEAERKGSGAAEGN
ncbi:hypothetical protein EDD15DRAFT_2197944 [Pisolithus albus]|nr:hypothetical protein EDD15DRAFT_2197944 [Pisolithus albus]